MVPCDFRVQRAGAGYPESSQTKFLNIQVFIDNAQINKKAISLILFPWSNLALYKVTQSPEISSNTLLEVHLLHKNQGVAFSLHASAE